MDYITIYVNENTKQKLDDLKEKYKVASLDAVIQILLVGK